MVDHESLSEREIEILRLVATGASNKQVARELYISANTVKVHLRNIFEKIDVASRTEATVYAIREGLVSMESDQEEGASSIADVTRSHTSDTWQTILRRPWLLAVMGTLSFVVGVIVVQGILQSVNTTPLNPSAPEVAPPDRWKQLADLPTARSGLGVATYENLIYAIAGETESGVTGIVERYDPEGDTWIVLHDKPTAAADVSAAIVGGRIYIPGGRLSMGDVTDILEIYDPRTDHWYRGADLPVAISAYALVSFEGRLYTFGGWDGEQYLAYVFEYDPDSNRWQECTPMPTPRGYAGATVIGGAIHIFGGFNGEEALSTNEIYFPERDNTQDVPWLNATSLLEGRYAMGVANIADIVHVIGGEGKHSQSLKYYPQRGEWLPFEEPFPKVWSHLGTAVIGPYLYGLGGQLEDTPTSKHMSYQAIYSISLPVVR